MSDKIFLKKYLENLSALIKPTDELISKIITVKDILLETKKNY